ncbi:hypothetical protein T12_11486 [Trichinella patagoniensis]|uniref:Uncharacterized protein n=1 Tax=Trichinella patagoniensis TaxID=990121 RepID=A0A0V0YYI1_9BILA|nr:hypothetical protein T12_11486 [Trichinella patagoniensis]
MREKLREGGGGSCHMRSSTQSSRGAIGDTIT